MIEEFVKIMRGMRLWCVMWWLCRACVLVTGECQWLHLELIKEMRIFCKMLFPVVEYAYSTIPTYPSGQIGFMLCSKDPVSVLHSTAVSHSSVATLVWKEPTVWLIRHCHQRNFSAFQKTNFKEPVKALSKEEIQTMDLKYYNPEIHRASFILPEFAKKVLFQSLTCTRLSTIHNCSMSPTFHSHVSFLSFFNINRYSMRHDQQKPLD